LSLYGEASDKMSIREIRGAAGKTQREVAAAVGVTERTYVRWEQGDVLPDAVNLIRLADYFRVQPRQLLPEGQPVTEVA